MVLSLLITEKSLTRLGALSISLDHTALVIEGLMNIPMDLLESFIRPDICSGDHFSFNFSAIYSLTLEVIFLKDWYFNLFLYVVPFFIREAVIFFIHVLFLLVIPLT
jgi:hypothetical protein